MALPGTENFVTLMLFATIELLEAYVLPKFFKYGKRHFQVVETMTTIMVSATIVDATIMSIYNSCNI